MAGLQQLEVHQLLIGVALTAIALTAAQLAVVGRAQLCPPVALEVRALLVPQEDPRLADRAALFAARARARAVGSQLAEPRARAPWVLHSDSASEPRVTKSDSEVGSAGVV